MSKVRTTGLIFQAENIDVPFKGGAAKNITSSISKTSQKVGKGPGNRKALQDISNSSAIRNDASVKKKIRMKDEQSLTDEVFLHDHKKCMETQRAWMDKQLFDAFLSEHGLLFPGPASPKSKEPEASIESHPEFLELEPVPELPMPEVADGCPSPIQWDSPPGLPLRYELPVLVLKP